uniref:Uncharacterized protein n=1 Tax=Nymphaea colorata TaxID=210225 RepID=A0A5K1CIL2_9MAGN
MVVVHLGPAISKFLLPQLLGLSPLFWPFNLYVPLARQLPSVCNAVSSTTTILVFRLRRIMLDQPVAAGGRSSSGISRWERAIRLLLQLLRLAPSSSIRRTPPPAALHLQSETLHSLSTITL